MLVACLRHAPDLTHCPSEYTQSTRWKGDGLGLRPTTNDCTGRNNSGLVSMVTIFNQNNKIDQWMLITDSVSGLLSVYALADVRTSFVCQVQIMYPVLFAYNKTTYVTQHCHRKGGWNTQDTAVIIEFQPFTRSQVQTVVSKFTTSLITSRLPSAIYSYIKHYFPFREVMFQQKLNKSTLGLVPGHVT